MSEIQRWMVCTSFDRGEGFGEMLADDDGDYYLCSDVDPIIDRVCVLRPEVLTFAEAMEKKLKYNDDKGGWQWMSLGEIAERIDDELEELTYALDNGKRGSAADEAVDVANFCMMFFDNALRRED